MLVDHIITNSLKIYFTKYSTQSYITPTITGPINHSGSLFVVLIIVTKL